ncbi:MAG: Hsp20/alpha crystallin family protein [Flavobacteriaceae bacterium]|nr:Hsp20/alpha crystallin family protein [Flavobacteriaceae bacterium]
MPLVQFNRRLPVLDRMFPEISDITNNMMTEDLFLRDNWMPAINVKEHKKEFEIEVSAPGFTKDNFEVSILDDVLTISAERKDEKEEKDENYSRREFYHNSFTRTFTLPKNVDLNKKIKANYENGILAIHLDKMEISRIEDKKKMIEIS